MGVATAYVSDTNAILVYRMHAVNYMATIAEPSVRSLFIEMSFNDQHLATGTGFVAMTAIGPALVTARHNVTGRHHDTGCPLSTTCGIPNYLNINHHSKQGLGRWVSRSEPLYQNEQPRWIEHPSLGAKVDVVALPLTQLLDVELYPYDLASPGPDMRVGPADVLSVVGFPFGQGAGGGFAIWATGFMASEPEIETPCFLVDCRSRRGQSGSPVIAYRNGGPVALVSGSTWLPNGPAFRFLGVYSGRLNEESDLGFVWKAPIVNELLQQMGR